MSMISEQVKVLREYSKTPLYLRSKYLYEVYDQIKYAADTIEALSEKLKVANMERSADDCGKSVLRIETPKVCIDCPCHFAGESGMVMCGVEKRELLSYDIESYKPDWCPLRESTDCGGWIPCKERLPDNFDTVLAFTEEKQNVTVARDGADWVLYDGTIIEEKVIAWQPLPEPYHES